MIGGIENSNLYYPITGGLKGQAQMSTESVEDTLKKSYDHKKLNKFNFHKNLKTHKSLSEVDNLVNTIIERYGNPQFTPLYRKAAWYLPEATIITLMEKAENADTSCNYFVKCAKNALRKLETV